MRPAEDPTPDREYTSKDVYESVVRAVRARCNDVQGPGARRRQIVTSLGGSYGRYQAADLNSALRAARERGDLIRWLDADGVYRHTPTDLDLLQEVVAYMNKHDYGPEPIERVAQRIREVRDA